MFHQLICKRQVWFTVLATLTTAGIIVLPNLIGYYPWTKPQSRALLYITCHLDMTAFNARINIEKLALPRLKPKTAIAAAGQNGSINALSPDFFSEIKKLTHVRTILFSLPMHQLLNILPTKFYTVHSNDCKLMLAKALATGGVIDQECIEDDKYLYKKSKVMFMKNSINQTTGSFHPFTHVNLGLRDFVQKDLTVDYLHIVNNATVVSTGDFFTEGYRFIIQRCQRRTTAPFNNPKHYNEVFSISQYWGVGFFHFTVEDFPRIITGLEYLLKNKNVKIHTHTKNRFVKDLLKTLGISSNRIVTGAVQADTLLVPRGSPCGAGPVFNLNVLSTFFLNTLDTTYQGKRDTIVLIKRTTRRWFNNHQHILKMLQGVAKNESKGLRVEVYGDRPVMGLQKTRLLFHRALMVVAPHGAGLSNIIFSQRGTCVVEGLCYNGQKVNLCYEHLAYVLGHRYHSVIKKYPCFQMKPKDLKPQVLQCLRDFMKNAT